MATFKIYPIYTGHSENDASFAIAKAKIGSKKYKFGHGCIAIRNNDNGEVTLLDTSMAHWTEVEANDLPYRSELEKGPTLDQALWEQAQIKTTDVKQIILSHMHQDHCWNMGLFSKDTPIYVQRKELEHAVAPTPLERNSYSLIDRPGCPCWAPHLRQFIAVDGDVEIEPGIKVLYTPGHTIGSQSVLVDTEKGRYIYVGDLYYTEENYQQGRPIGWYYDLGDWYRSHAKVVATGAVPLSIHMISTFNEKVYG